MKEIRVVEFSSFDGSIANGIQYAVSSKRVFDEKFKAIEIKSITMGIHHIINGMYPTFPYTLAIVVFEVEREDIKNDK